MTQGPQRALASMRLFAGLAGAIILASAAGTVLPGYPLYSSWWFAALLAALEKELGKYL